MGIVPYSWIFSMKFKLDELINYLFHFLNNAIYFNFQGGFFQEQTLWIL